MTAIAAAIACSTPSFAQSADPPAAETPAPVVAAPVAAEPIVPDTPLAAEPIVPDTPVAADTLAPAKAAAKPAVRKATTARAPIVRSRPAAARVASAAPAAATPAAASAAPVAEVPAVEPLPAQPEAAPVVAPVEATDTSSMGAMIPALAAGGLAILALAGVGLALRRRKRRAAETEEAELRAQALAAADPEPVRAVESEPEPVPERAPVSGLGEPAFAAAAAPAVVASEPLSEIDDPVADLPQGVDVAPGSRVEAAYAGPTADNPSLSIKKRLKRAAFFDQREFLVEAGEVAPMADDAGLPDAVELPPEPREPIDKAG